MRITNKFPNLTEKEFKAIENEAKRLEGMGYNVPDIIIKPIANAKGMTVRALGIIYIHPSLDLEDLKFTVRHEIGHNNEPEKEFNIWSDETWEDERNNSENFADDFARRTK